MCNVTLNCSEIYIVVDYRPFSSILEQMSASKAASAFIVLHCWFAKEYLYYCTKVRGLVTIPTMKQDLLLKSTLSMPRDILLWNNSLSITQYIFWSKRFLIDLFSSRGRGLVYVLADDSGRGSSYVQWICCDKLMLSIDTSPSFATKNSLNW